MLVNVLLCCSFCQVWCVESEELKSFNWTVDSGTHSIEISTLQPGRLYWVTVAAVNGAGVGVQSDPYKLLIGKLINYH